MSNTLNALLNLLNNQIEALNKSGHQLFDYDNPDFYISQVVYDSESDRIFFRTAEKKQSWD